MIDELTRVAYHEAAHAVAQVRFNMGSYNVSIVSDEHTLGQADMIDSYHDAETSKDYLISLLAGHSACIHLEPSSEQWSREGARGDFDSAERVLLHLLGKDVSEACWNRWLKKTWECVTAEANWRAIKEIAAELLEYQTLDDAELEMIIAMADGDTEALPALLNYRMYIQEPPRIVLPDEPGASVEGRNFVVTRRDGGGVIVTAKNQD